jgi:hypothetical protein
MGLPFYPVGFMASAGSYLLDVYPNALVAYSFRQLKTGVTNVCRIRRTLSAGEDAEKDFTAAEVADGTATDWVNDIIAGNDGYVAKMYDIVNAVGANQPWFVVSGTMKTLSSLPTMEFNTATQHDLTQSTTSNTSASTFVFSVNRHGAVGGGNMYGATSGNRQEFRLNGSLNSMTSETPTGYNTDLVPSTSTDYIISAAFLNNAAYCRQNQTQSSTLTTFGTTTTAKTGVTYGSFKSGSGWYDGLVSEIIAYDSDQSSNVSAIEDAINDYYSIY